ncbi:T9SS C-terminal target domain-containing protein [Chryseobacterium koreense]|uniref:PKD/Chitinase domain-containing protein n=1 Tax=Chryseobacterium koreense CCUG 49689 TaxID=1304281 RepID=A0A0J7IXV0_9FLAO|nr:T9SS C-terminal target domain-containing protein [Chryseobacterium koreense]KMQ70629.1 hypothetical protein ACM44_11235 [Chryseobacterium koreense CCUG 49689]MBB5334574.1 gliding motility-associated-like protein [Chryseobacterium koreense]
MKKIFYLFFALSVIPYFSNFNAQTTNRKPEREKSTAASHRAGAFIDVNVAANPESAYSISQLIKDVLISGGGTCVAANVSNVTVSPNLAANNANRSWGYFSKGTTAFPFSKGIVLATGFARNAGNSYIASTLSDNIATGGDFDLSQAMGSGASYFDATSVEFDFVPQSTQISFNYLFASEEYSWNNSFPCSGFTDGFALLLKKVGDANYTNMAVLPGGAGPVSVTNIIPSNFSCGPLNAQYFGGLNTSNIETNYNGRTIPLKAVATVIPGQTYHFKMVLADAIDRQYDSAVFLEAGSFNIGVQVQDGAGVTLPGQINMCGTTPQTLVAQVSAPSATFYWYFNGNLIPGATTNSYVATQPGTYKVEVFLPGNNCPGTATVEILAKPYPVVQNASLTACGPLNAAVFNLKSAEPNISTSPGLTFTYYVNLADAEAGNANNIPNPTNYTSGTKKIYVRVWNGACHRVAELQLDAGLQPANPAINAPSTQICGNSSITLTSSIATGNVWSTGETSQSITVTAAGTYTLKVVNGFCSSAVASVNITKIADPNLQITGNTYFCSGSSTTLTSSVASGNVWSTGETTQSIIVTTPGTYTVTVTPALGCSFNKSVVVTESAQVTASIPAPVPMCNNTPQTLVAQTNIGTNFVWYLNGSIIPGATTSTYVATQPGIYKVLVSVPGNNCTATAQVTIIGGAFPTVTNAIQNKCSSTSTYTFNLKDSESSLSTTAGVAFQYYEIQTDADAGNGNFIPNPTAYNSASKKIYVRVSNGSCYRVAELQLNVHVIPNTPVIAASNTEICGNTSVTLTSSNPTGNVWSNGATTQSITVTAGGTYSVKTVDSFCESASASIVITKIADPNLKITGNLNMCSGSSTTLTSSLTTGIVWSTGETTPSITVSTPGTYTVTATLGTACVFTKSVTVVQVPQVTVSIAPPTIMCSNTPQTLVAQTNIGTVYQWYLNNILIPGANSSTYVATQLGTYKVVASIPGNTCPGTAQVKITGGMYPMANDSLLNKCSATNTAIFKLSDAQADISTTPGVTFRYYEAQSDADAGNTNFIPNPNTYLSATKKIFVRVTSGLCYKVSELQLNVNLIPATPVITASNLQICGDSTVTLTSNVATGNLWSTGETTQSITVSTGGTYTVKTVGTFCDSGLASINIVKIADPNIQISGQLSFCNGFSTTLTSSSATGNVWNTGATSNSIVVTAPGNYTVTVTLPSGCQFSKTVTVVKTPPIVVQIAAPQVITCTNSQITLDASSSQYQAGDTFLWVASNGGVIVSGANTLNPVVSAAGTYTLTINGINCAGSKSIVVTENKVKPVVNISAPRIKICEGESVTLTATGAQTYLWANGNQTTNSITVNPTTTTTYTVTGTGANGCASVPTKITITVLPKITSDVEGGPICAGGSILLDAGSGPGYTYLWSNGATTQTINATNVGNYSVTVNNTVCSATFTAQVVPGIPPTLVKVLYENDNLTIIAENAMQYPLEYSIDGGFTWQSSNVFVGVNSNVNYQVAVRVKNTTCRNEAEYFTFKLSNVITPNDDGINDRIDFGGISVYQEFQAVIYDRYGVEVFRADTNRTYWDGKQMGKTLPSASYWYVVSWDDPITKEKHTKTGWILLKTH